jgi:hypothetical protein
MSRSKEPDYAGKDWLDVPDGEEPGDLKPFGGSQNDDFNHTLVNQATDAVWEGHSEPQRKRQRQGIMGAMLGMAPQDEIEGMLDSQLLVTHNAIMESHRRAGIENQPFEIRQAELNLAGKLSRSFAALVETLDRHRGKGRRQQIRVEHVHVHEGGQAAFVGTMNGRGVLAHKVKEDEPNARKAIAYQPETPMRGADPERESLLVTTDDGEAPV